MEFEPVNPSKYANTINQLIRTYELIFWLLIRLWLRSGLPWLEALDAGTIEVKLQSALKHSLYYINFLIIPMVSARTF